MARGASDKEIAQELGLSWHTVRTYARQIHRLTGIERRAELVALAAGRAR